MQHLVDAFATAGHRLPEAALREAAARWEEAAPPLLALLGAYADGADRSEQARDACFFIAFLCAQMRETRAFAPLCRLARDAAAIDELLGDAITGQFNGMLADTFDGDLDALLALAGDAGADEYVRNAAFEALTLLTAQGRVAREAATAALRDLHDRMAGRRDRAGMAWVGWAGAVAQLGIAALAPQARAVFSRGWIGREIMGRADFEKDLREGVGAPEGEVLLARLDRAHVRPVGDVVPLLSRWYGFSEAYAQEMEARERRLAEARLADAMAGDDEIARDFPLDLSGGGAVARPKVGRNDPCPCGSGRKFKKCCGAA